MPVKRTLLKREARKEMAGATPNAMLMTLLYIVLTTGVSTVAGMFVENPFVKMEVLMEAGLEPAAALAVALSGTGAVALFLTILIALYSTVVGFGYTRWTLEASRGVNGEYADLINGFSMAGRVLLLQVVLVVYYLLWYLAIFTPIIVAAVLVPGLYVLIVPLMLAGLVVYISKVLRYSMATLCLIDSPDAGTMAAIRRSRDMMEGNCASFFLLMLSFFGWYLLLYGIMVVAEGAVVTILGGQELVAAVIAGDILAVMDLAGTIMGNGVATLIVNLAILPLQLWLTPYMAITHARYYDLLQTRNLDSIYV